MRDVIYDGIKLNDFMIIKDIKESLLPNIDNVTLKMNSNVGLKFVNQELGSRVFSIDVEILSDSQQDKQEKINRLAPLLFTNEEKDLILDNVRRYKAVVDGSSNINNLMYDGLLTLTFVAYDPIAYGEEISLNIESGDELYNPGNYKTRPIIEVIPLVAPVEIRLKNGEEYDYVKINKIGGLLDPIKIDFINEVVTINGENIMADVDPLGDFFYIPPGDFSLEISNSNFTHISFYERWL